MTLSKDYDIIDFYKSYSIDYNKVYIIYDRILKKGKFKKK